MPTVTVDNTNLNQVYTKNTDFIISTEITRSSNTNIYEKSGIVNNSGSNTLPYFDFSTFGINVNNRILTIRTIVLTSNNGGSTRIKPLLYFYNSNNLIGSTLTDNSFFNPSYDESKLKQVCTIEPLPVELAYGNQIYIILQNELTRIGRLDSTGKLYFALLCDQGYTPKSEEKFFLTIKGYLS